MIEIPTPEEIIAARQAKAAQQRAERFEAEIQRVLNNLICYGMADFLDEKIAFLLREKDFVVTQTEAFSEYYGENCVYFRVCSSSEPV